MNADETQYVEYSYPARSSCRYYIQAPSGYEIELSCSLRIATDSSGRCIGDYFYISTNGEKATNFQESFCGIKTVTRVSIFTYIVFCE